MAGLGDKDDSVQAAAAEALVPMAPLLLAMQDEQVRLHHKRVGSDSGGLGLQAQGWMFRTACIVHAGCVLEATTGEVSVECKGRKGVACGAHGAAAAAHAG
jgi:hypothetical protein